METVAEASSELKKLAEALVRVKEAYRRKRMHESDKALILDYVQTRIEAVAIAVAIMNGGSVSTGKLAANEGWPHGEDWGKQMGQQPKGDRE